MIPSLSEGFKVSPGPLSDLKAPVCEAATWFVDFQYEHSYNHIAARQAA
jgi:hypothetical protein